MITSLSGLNKGITFTVLFEVNKLTSGLYPTNQAQTDNFITKISKDNETYQDTINSAVYVTEGLFSIILTAEEMNADQINITAVASGSSALASAILFTGTANVSAQSPEAMTSICQAVNEGYVVSQIATSESGYNYYGLTNSNRWWLIIREKTDFTNVDYKMNRENRQTFANGWTDRATLNYSDIFPL